MKPGIWHWSAPALIVYVIGGCGMRQVFRKQPENRSSIEGEGSFLECEVEGVSGPVQWVKDGLLLGPGPRLPGFPRYRMTGNAGRGVFNLQIEKVELEDEASYQCQVGRSDFSRGIISRTAWLQILIPPKVPMIEELATETPLTWVAGEEYTLTCLAKDSKPASNIVFTKSGVELSGSQTTVYPGSEVKLFNTVSVIRITPESSDNGNEMVCGALNAALTQPRTSGFTMNILFPPQVPRIEGYDHQVNAGVTLQLVCSSTGGNPLATLQWLQGETVLSRKWDTDVKTQTAQSVLSYPVKPQDNGINLTCEAMNLVTANPLRTVIILHVMFPPARVIIVGLTRVVEGKEVSLSCSTSPSNPAVRIRWWASGQELNVTEATYSQDADGGVTTMSNITMTTSRQDNGMRIVCEAVNEILFVTKSMNVIINVYYPPERIWIQGPPETLPFHTGTDVTLSCFASGGNPAARLTWRKDSKRVSGAVYMSTGKLASSRLTITTEPSDNKANYQCSATNEAATNPLTTDTRISVQFAPIDMKITTSSAIIHQGELITLTCHIGSSNPVPQVIWMKAGVRMSGKVVQTQQSEYGGQSITAEMTMIATSSDNGKRVTCEAYSSVLKEARNTFYKLDIRHPPEFLPTQVRVVLAEERGAVVLPIKISANPSEVTYTWSRNGQLLVKDGPSRHHLKSDGTLEIWNLTRDDAGFYRIELRNEEGKNEMLVKVDVLYSPRIHRISDPAEVMVGGSVELVCTADANPVHSNMVIWKWTGQGREVTEDDQLFMNTTTKLIIEDANRSDAGRYECSADNGISPEATASAQLIVQFKPELQKAVELSKVAVSGDGTTTATLTCKAEGIPNVQFDWAKNGVTLDPSNPRYLQTTLHEGPLHTAQLSIVNASAALDYATFTCTAQNPLGLDVFDIHLVSTSRPDPPTGLKVLSKTHNSVTLAWSAGFNGGLEQTFQVRYFWAGSQSYLYADVYPPQARSFTITGLRPQTLYNFSVNALNTLGASDYADNGVEISLITTGHPERSPFPTESLLSPELRPGKNKENSGSYRVQTLDLNDYGDEINISSKQTLFIDSESDLSSRSYESYDGSSSHSDPTPGSGNRIPPAGKFRPRMLPLQESAEWAEDEYLNIPGYGQREADGNLPDTHLMDQGIYEDVSVEPFPWSGRSVHSLTSGCPGLSPRLDAMSRGVCPVGVERVPGFADYDEPFELQGELV